MHTAIKRARLAAQVYCGAWLFIGYVHVAAVPGGRAALDKLRAQVTQRPAPVLIAYGQAPAPLPAPEGEVVAA